MNATALRINEPRKSYRWLPKPAASQLPVAKAKAKAKAKAIRAKYPGRSTLSSERREAGF